MDDETHYGIDRSTLTDEERAIYDASFVGAWDRLHREVEGLKQAIIDALFEVNPAGLVIERITEARVVDKEQP